MCVQHVHIHITVDEQLSTCSQQHMLHTPYTCVYMQIEYCEVLLIPVGIADYFNAYHLLLLFYLLYHYVCAVHSTEGDSD